MPIAIATAAAPTAGTLPVAQAISIDCKGLTPVAVLVFATRATSLATVTAGAMCSAGFSDGTTTRVASAMSEDGQLAGSADTGIQYNNVTKIVRILTTGDETIDGEADFSSLAADTLNISWSDLPSTACQLMVVAFFGTRWQAKTGALAASTTLNGTATVSGLAFRPCAIISIGARAGFASTGANADMHFGFAALNSDGTVQGQTNYAVREGDRASPTVCISTLRTDSIGARMSTTVEEARYEITSGTSDGFVLTTRVAGGVAYALGWIALYTDGGRANVGVVNFTEGGGGTTGTSTAGNKTVTGLSGRIGSLFMIGTALNTVDSYITSAPAANWSIGAANLTQSGDIGYGAADGAASSATHCITDGAKLVDVPDDAGAIDWAATLVSFGSGSFTINVGTASPADHYAAYLALEELSDRGWLDARSGNRWRRCLARR